MKYWMVYCNRGHYGSRRSGEIKFAIAAKTLIDAFSSAAKMPSVKHSQLPTFGYEISYEEYCDYRKESAYDRFPKQRKKYKRKK